MQFPKIMLDQKQAIELSFGRSVQLIKPNTSEGTLRLYSESGGAFLGLGELDNTGILSVKRLLRTN
jgi:hypothetical protein